MELTIMATPGKFIVIEGTDGSGKTVQFERLILAFPESVRIGALDFPQYNEPSSYFVQKYLTGKYGSDVGPYTASTLFAMDRFDARLKILQWIESGRLVVANRFVASNMAHQGAKIEDRAAREKFYRWLYDLEYEIFAIPKPDLNILLRVPPAVSAALLGKRGTRGGLSKDIHEESMEHQERAAQAYDEIAAFFPHDFTVIECAPHGEMLSPEAIHENVLAAVRTVVSF